MTDGALQDITRTQKGLDFRCSEERRQYSHRGKQCGVHNVGYTQPVGAAWFINSCATHGFDFFSGIYIEDIIYLKRFNYIKQRKKGINKWGMRNKIQNDDLSY